MRARLGHRYHRDKRIASPTAIARILQTIVIGHAIGNVCIRIVVIRWRCACKVSAGELTGCGRDLCPGEAVGGPIKVEMMIVDLGRGGPHHIHLRTAPCGSKRIDRYLRRDKGWGRSRRWRSGWSGIAVVLRTSIFFKRYFIDNSLPAGALNRHDHLPIRV